MPAPPKKSDKPGQHSMARKLLLLLAILVIATVASMTWPQADSRVQVPTGLVLLLPHADARQHTITQAWLDAAHEEGLPSAP